MEGNLVNSKWVCEFMGLGKVFFSIFKDSLQILTYVNEFIEQD